MPFDTTEVEDGTGKSTALVYEQNVDAAAWLSRRGHTKFDGQDDDDQQVSLIRATELAEDAIRSRFRGRNREEDQALLFPAVGAYSQAGPLFKVDEIPKKLLEGIRLLAEHVAAGTLMPLEGASAIKREKTKRGEIEYREGFLAEELSSNHPTVWRRLRAALPRGL